MHASPDSRLRIALFSDVYRPTVNGVVNHLALLKQYLTAWGHQVYLFVPGSGKRPKDEPNLVRIPGIPIAQTGYHVGIGLDRASRALLATMDLVHVHQPFISGSFGLYCANHYKTPLIFTNHTRYDLYVKAYLPLFPAALSETALQTYFHHFSRRCAALIAPSPSMARLMKQWRVEGRVEVIPNGIELDRFHHSTRALTRAALDIAPESVIGIYVGRLSPEKSLDRLLNIFAQVVRRVPQAHLLMVGDGSEQDDLRRLAEWLGIGNCVTFTGAVAYDAVPAYLALADFFVSASVSEVHPLTFIEAAAAGLPALGIRSTGVVDIIREDETGLLAPDEDGAFADCMVRLLHDAELRGRLGQQARVASRAYSAETNARRILALYREICAAEPMATSGK